MSGTDAAGALRLVVLTAGTGDPSSTRLLGDRIGRAIATVAATRGREVAISTIDLRELLPELPAALGSRLLGPRFEAAVAALREADALVAATPVYKAGASGLFTSFFQVLDDDLLIGKPVVLAATAGTARHALVVDEQLRGLFAFLRSLPVPTSIFASTEDWSEGELGSRIDRAALEAVLLMESGFQRAVRGDAWSRYPHDFGSDGGAELGIDLDSDLMRLATGGGMSSRPSA